MANNRPILIIGASLTLSDLEGYFLLFETFLSNSHTLGSTAHINYDAFTRELERTRDL